MGQTDMMKNMAHLNGLGNSWLARPVNVSLDKVSNGVPWGSVLGFELFNIFINASDKGIAGVLIESVEDIKLRTELSHWVTVSQRYWQARLLG